MASNCPRTRRKPPLRADLSRTKPGAASPPRKRLCSPKRSERAIQNQVKISKHQQNDFMLSAERTIYTCPMHPEVQQDHPGNCPKCGMTLEPKTVSTVE